MENVFFRPEYAQSFGTSPQEARLRNILEKAVAHPEHIHLIPAEDLDDILRLLEKDRSAKRRQLAWARSEFHRLEEELETLEQHEQILRENPAVREHLSKSWTVDMLDLSLRITTRLRRAGICTVEELCQLRAEDIEKKCRLSDTYIQAIQEKLARYGLSLRTEAPVDAGSGSAYDLQRELERKFDELFGTLMADDDAEDDD